MIGAIIGIFLGLTSYFIGLPLIAPLFGAALGVNAIIQERRGKIRNVNQLIAGIAAIVIGALVALLASIRIQ